MIKFNGCDPLIPNEKTIEIKSDGKTWDLHNACSFNGFRYNVEKSSLQLEWDYFDYGKGIPVNRVLVTLNEITFLKIGERDAEMPIEEDSTLNEMLLSDGGEIHFSFCGGVTINVKCSGFDFSTSILAV